MSEFESSTPNETGQTSESLDPEIRTAFQDYIHSEHSETPHERPEKIEIIFEDDKLFAITNLSNHPDRWTNRAYFQSFVEKNGQNEAEQLKFAEVAHVTITTDALEMDKTGRPTGNYFERETIHFSHDLGRDLGYCLSYGLLNPKGDALEANYGTELDFGYRPDGRLYFLKFRGKNLEGVARDYQFTKTPFYYDTQNTGALAEIEEAADSNTPLVAGNFQLEVKFNEDESAFLFRFTNDKGEPEYTVSVPLQVSIDTVMNELGARELIANPTQPSAGLPFQSNGDKDWRYKNFGQLMGISVAPIDKV